MEINYNKTIVTKTETQEKFIINENPNNEYFFTYEDYSHGYCKKGYYGLYNGYSIKIVDYDIKIEKKMSIKVDDSRIQLFLNSRDVKEVKEITKREFSSKLEFILVILKIN